MAPALIRSEISETQQVSPVAIRAANQWQRHIKSRYSARMGQLQVVDQREAVRTTSDADRITSPEQSLSSHRTEETKETNVLAYRPLSTPVPDQLLDLVGSFARREPEIQITTKRLVSLLQDNDDDGEGALRPTPGAFLTAWNLIMDAYRLMTGPFPKASPGSDEEGGLRVQWSHLGRQVRLVVPGSQQRAPYIYHEEGDDFATEGNVSGQTLAAWLCWLTKG
jgi:hypothetical protein